MGEEWEVFSPLWMIETVYPKAHDDKRFLKSLHKEVSRWLTLLRQRKYHLIPYTPAIREKLMRELGITLPPKKGKPHGALWDVRVHNLVIDNLQDRSKLYTALTEDWVMKLYEDYLREERELLETVKEEIKAKGVRSVALKYLKGKGWIHGYRGGKYPTPLDWVLSHPKHRGIAKFIVFYALEEKRRKVFEAWTEAYKRGEEVVRGAGYLKKGKVREVAREVLRYVLDRKVKKPYAFLKELKAHVEFLLSPP